MISALIVPCWPLQDMDKAEFEECLRNWPTHPFWDVIIYLPVESIITQAPSRGVSMETSVRRGTRHRLCSLFTSLISQIFKMATLG